MSFSPDSLRIDKWLWCVRQFKTRALATAACRAGSVLAHGEPVKPAREARPGDIICVRAGLITRTLQVLASPASRVSAKLVPEYCTDLTPPEEIEKLRDQRVQQFLARERGLGRPTKRDRRAIDRMRDGF
ncbi:MAG: RNA-binding S4 domain-containing protein [Cephaloticoccus sp.]|nr:RNA-binding S4 domain-containing protein [Cephaloticoccus sp.]MCF7758903.1 RNA-binding S4 domain-containing protein [Cephaloticoccus sp.]